ncbi:unnamed protein product [Brassica rapa subsp. narinosa]|uniref:Peptidase C1A papain C-terminal domain-containing protein n=2 Tax=Brassica campestris TaxID=3711 RepID=M4DG67_BRACM|nr:unnamed protein product [Brassica rapa]
MVAPENKNGDSNNKKCCLMDYAFEYIFKNGGVRKEEDYPYSMEDESEMVTISGQQDVPRNDEKSLLKALAHHLSGVFDGRCSVNLDHGIAAVVYGSSKGSDHC